MKRRLFTFGCSFSAYAWPTWATLLSTSEEFEAVQNWGIPGLGNRAIAERIAECNIKCNFTEYDTVIVQWTTHLRHDFFHQDGLLKDRVAGWKTAGSIFNLENRAIYDEKWLRTFFDEEAYAYHTLNHIHMSQQLLNNTGCRWFMTSIGDIRNLCTDFNVGSNYGEKSIFSKIEQLFSKKDFPLYLKTPSLKVYDQRIWGENKDKWLDPILSYLENKIKDDYELFNFFYNEEYQNTIVDYHPKTKSYYYWLDKVLREKTSIKINEESCLEMCDRVENLYSKMNGRKKPFEIALYHERFNNSCWPEKLLGFTNF